MKDLLSIDLRPASHVMRLSQMGAMFPTKISFMRLMMRQLARDKSPVIRHRFNLDADGYGTAVYSVSLGGRDYSLFATSQPLDPSQRTDRVIAEAWDAAFVLYDGVPDDQECDRLAENAPKQEAGRFAATDLCLSRANKSVRLFAATVDALQTGRPIDPSDYVQTGYLMRTTAVYGNGKFGLADRDSYADRPDLAAPFMAEMLTVWLIRHFTFDLVEHVGRGTLPVGLKRALGVGNSTGLGMAPFLVSHPDLIHAWIHTRETHLARALQTELDDADLVRLTHLARRAMQHLLEWNVPDPEHQDRIVALRGDWAAMVRMLNGARTAGALDLEDIIRSAPTSDFEELAIAWIIEALVDPSATVATDLCGDGSQRLDAGVSCAAMRALIEAACDFATAPDYDAPNDSAQFWYVSQSKLEPRIGQRYAEPGADRESPLDVARRIAELSRDLADADGPLWRFLAQHPRHRDAAERVQRLQTRPYADIRNNLICETTQPIDMLRCKLSFFGATKFDPKSKLWTRIALGQGAPLADDIASGAMDDQIWLSTFAPCQ